MAVVFVDQELQLFQNSAKELTLFWFGKLACAQRPWHHGGGDLFTTRSPRLSDCCAHYLGGIEQGSSAGRVFDGSPLGERFGARPARIQKSQVQHQ
jgi:hypothetical protein